MRSRNNLLSVLEKDGFAGGLMVRYNRAVSIQPIMQLHLKSSRKANNSKGTILLSQEELLCIRPTPEPHQYMANEAVSTFQSVTYH